MAFSVQHSVGMHCLPWMCCVSLKRVKCNMTSVFRAVSFVGMWRFSDKNHRKLSRHPDSLGLSSRPPPLLVLCEVCCHGQCDWHQCLRQTAHYIPDNLHVISTIQESNVRNRSVFRNRRRGTPRIYPGLFWTECTKLWKMNCFVSLEGDNRVIRYFDISLDVTCVFLRSKDVTVKPSFKGTWMQHVWRITFTFLRIFNLK
jgi:hypothetical protein